MSDFLEMRNITKKFPGVLANDNISLCVSQGEIHAILGENGAGKTTLMKILYGLYEPDKGEILFKGKPVKIKSPQDAISLGIGMVHQHFMLIPTFTVAQNIALGEKSTLFPYLNLKKIKNKLPEHSVISVNPDAFIWQLSVGEQQRVEILKALYHGAELLILDEPTAVLTPKETQDFFSMIKTLSARGYAIIFITHKLREIMEISHRVTVLRDGKHVDTVNTKDTDEETLARMMVGRDITSQIKKSPFRRDGKPVIEVKNLSAPDDRKLMAFQNITFTVRAGEIFGLAGVDGNGQRELSEVITGMRKATEGKFIINNLDLTGALPGKIKGRHVAHIPEDRRTTGSILNFTITENAILGHSSFLNGFFLDYRKAEEFAENLIRDYDIRTTGSDATAGSLSGGNLQKLIIGRELSGSPAFVVAVHPTRGLDLGAIEYTHNTLLRQRARGAAILLISADLNELFELSDTIGVMYKGKLAGQFPTEEATLEKVGLLMAGGEGRGEIIERQV